MSSQRIDDGERRRRLLLRHHLVAAAPAASVVEAAASTVGLHGSDPATGYLAVRARLPGATVADLERSLYEKRELVRILGMRRTLFVVPLDLAAIIRAACAEPIARTERRRLESLLETADPTRDAAAWLARVAADVEAALARHESAAATELTAEVPALKEQFRFGQGRRWAGSVGLSTRLLFQMAAEWRIVRGRPRGSWISGQYRWASMASWVPDLPDSPEPAAARALLVERWLRAFGPGRERDLAWWSGLTLGQLRPALSAVGAIAVRLDDGDGLVLPDDLEASPPVEPEAIFLPGLDPTPMGWKVRDWFVGAHGRDVFDSNGNIGPTVWWDGRIVGAWGQRPDATVGYRLLDDVGREAAVACDAAATSLETWLAGTRVMPRFPAPEQLAIAAGA